MSPAEKADRRKKFFEHFSVAKPRQKTEAAFENLQIAYLWKHP